MKSLRPRKPGALKTFTVIAILLAIYGLIGTMDRIEQERAEAHRAEVIAAAKAEFKRRQWEGLEEKAEYLTFPIAAYNK